MKKIKQLSLVGLALAFILSSCSMDKRVYTSGYHIEWKNRNHSSDKKELVKNNTTNEIKSENKKHESTVVAEQSETSLANNSEVIDNSITASTNNSIFIPTPHKINWNKKNNKTVASESKSKTTSETKTIEKKLKQPHKKDSKKADGGAKGKSQLIALLLCIFLGRLGIHRFYLGYTGLGVMYLLFLVFGLILTLILIGWAILLALLILNIIDLIRIITGTLKPKGGEYETKF